MRSSTSSTARSSRATARRSSSRPTTRSAPRTRPLIAARAGSGQARSSSSAPRRRPSRAFIDGYQDYFERHNARVGGSKKHARSAAARRAGAGARAVRARPQARGRAHRRRSRARPRSHASPTPRRSAASSRSPKPTCSTCEYWPLEQAKLGKAKEPPLAGQVVAITGAGGAIGAATAQAFAAAGAEVALLDVELTRPPNRRRRSGATPCRSPAT